MRPLAPYSRPVVSCHGAGSVFAAQSGRTGGGPAGLHLRRRPHGQTVRLKCKAGTGRQPEAQRTFQQTAVLVGTCCLVIRFMNNVMRVLPPPTNDNQP